MLHRSKIPRTAARGLGNWRKAALESFATESADECQTGLCYSLNSQRSALTKFLSGPRQNCINSLTPLCRLGVSLATSLASNDNKAMIDLVGGRCGVMNAE